MGSVVGSRGGLGARLGVGDEVGAQTTPSSAAQRGVPRSLPAVTLQAVVNWVDSAAISVGTSSQS